MGIGESTIQLQDVADVLFVRLARDIKQAVAVCLREEISVRCVFPNLGERSYSDCIDSCIDGTNPSLWSERSNLRVLENK